MINKKTFKLSIIIPCYNEKNTIKKVIERINQSLEYYKILRFEILIVDDQSNDGTKEILNNLANQEKIQIYFHDKNLGKGAAIHTALKYANGDITIIQDADLEYDPSHYEIFIEEIKKKKEILALYGSRVLGKDSFQNAQNFSHKIRIWGNIFLTFVSNKINNQNLTDAHTCYKMFQSKIF